MENNSIPIPEKKKRGRKSKKELELIAQNKEALSENEDSDKSELKVPKKRGRKPRGGKIFPKMDLSNMLNNEKNNIILHLKCSLNDLNNNNELSNNIENYQFNQNKISDLNYEVINKNFSENNYEINYQDNNKIEKPNNILCETINKNDIENKISNKIINEKLEQLAFNLHTNNVCDKKSACFWCTYDFDNPPIYIPKFELNKSYHVYGCFCSPECASAHLMNDRDIDNASRFERYQLLNNIYCKIYDYNKNIKPAPNPYYILDKFYGNLSIQEYRKLLKNERLLLIVDKPLTRTLPELYQESNENISINKTSSTSIMKKNNNISKNNILNENFNVK